jgi:hypothetical protein
MGGGDPPSSVVLPLPPLLHCPSTTDVKRACRKGTLYRHGTVHGIDHTRKLGQKVIVGGVYHPIYNYLDLFQVRLLLLR